MQINPPAQRARRIALVLSAIAVMFAFGFGFLVRRWWHESRATGIDIITEYPTTWWLLGALTLLLVAMVLRIIAAICELVWLERTWSNLPITMRRVGPIEDVTPIHIFGFSFIPVVAWFWKLGLVASVSNGLEQVRKTTPFKAPVPKWLGMTAVMLGWFPGLNIYIAPFLWEMFARRIDVVCIELASANPSTKDA